jgi:hypothetical protein
MAAAFLLAAPGAPLFAAPAPGETGGEMLTAEQAMANYHRRFSLAGGAACAAADAKDELVVCGRRPFHDRASFPEEPGASIRHAGEAMTARDAMSADRCIRLCEQPVTVNIFEVVAAAPKIIRHILHGDD